MRVYIVNNIDAATATNEVNAFIASIEETHYIIDVNYRTPATNHTAWNCILITYKKKERTA